MSWGIFKSVGLFLVKAIVGAESLSPASGTGPAKKATVQDMVQGLITALVGDAGAALLSDPKVLAAFSAANDAIVAFQNILAAAHAALPPMPPS